MIHPSILHANQMINNLRRLAQCCGYRIVFKNHPSYNEFTIFIYDKDLPGRYIVGYDGSWLAQHDSIWSFLGCYKMAINYIYINKH